MKIIKKIKSKIDGVLFPFQLKTFKSNKVVKLKLKNLFNLTQVINS